MLLCFFVAVVVFVFSCFYFQYSAEVSILYRFYNTVTVLTMETSTDVNLQWCKADSWPLEPLSLWKNSVLIVSESQFKYHVENHHHLFNDVQITGDNFDHSVRNLRRNTSKHATVYGNIENENVLEDEMPQTFCDYTFVGATNHMVMRYWISHQFFVCILQKYESFKNV